MAINANGMTFAQLVAAVYTETNRPDLVAETTQALLEAVLTIHCSETFYKDIRESLIVFDNANAYIQQIDTTVLGLFRSVSYVRKTDPGINMAEQFNSNLPNGSYLTSQQLISLKRMDPSDPFDSYGYEKTDVWYQAGNQLNMKSSTPLGYAKIGYYAYPQLDGGGANFNSWIANELPYCLIYKAAANIFAKIGEATSYSIYMRPPNPSKGDETGGLFYQQYAILKRLNITFDE